MAVLALSAVGAAAGAAIGGTFLGVSAASWGWMAGSMLGNALFAEDVQGPRLNDLRVTGTEYGATIPWVAGSPRIAGQIVWASAKRETANTQSAKGGPEQTTYTYDCDLLILLTENEIAGVSRIWSNSELVYGAGTTKSGVWGGITVYTGAADQLPDPTYEASVGAGNAPAYRGRGYVVISGLQLGNSGQIPNLTFEVGTALDRDYSSIKYLIQETGTNPSFDETSIYDWSVTLGTGATIIGDGVALLGGAYNAITLGPASSTIDDHAGDYCLEFDVNVLWEDVPTTVARIGPDVTMYLRTYGGSPNLQVRYALPNGTLRILTFNPTDPAYDIAPIDARWVTLILQRVNNQMELQIDGAIIDSYTLTGGEIAPITLSGVKHGLGFDQDGVSIGTGPFHIRNFRFSTRQMYPLGTGVQTRTFPLTNYWQSEVFGSQTPQALDLTVEAMLGRSGYVADDYALVGFDAESELVRALAVGQVSGTRTTLDVLKSAYFFEASKSDKIYIRPRATTPVATISYAELGTSTDAGGSDQAFELTKSNDLEVPAQIALSYANMAGDYNSATEYSDRVLSQQETISGVHMPLGFLPAEAKAIADGLIIDAANSVVRATLRVPLKYAYIEPGDVFNAVNDDGRTYRLRVQTKRDSLTLIELECVLDDVGALDSAAVTDAGYTEAAVVQVASSEFEALDIPILRDADNGPGYYIGVAPVIAANPYEWKGALVARSWDDVSYAELFQTTAASVMGACSTTLGNWTGGNVWDETNTLTVVTTGGELASSTKAALQLDPTLNVAAIGSQATGWEVVRFVNATLTAANTYVLSGLHRGFRGTEWRMASHGAGEQFVLLNAGVGHVQSQTNQIGLERHIKAVTFGLLLSSATSEAFTDTGVALKPFSPANPVALASGSDLVVTWQRRTRVSYTYLGATPTVPLGESAEQYRVRIYDGATLVRTDTVATPTYTYTAASLAADGFASTDPVTFEICQVSEIVGAGYPATIQGTAP